MYKVVESAPSKLSRILELDRLEREGATLKNVSDNMRSLSACIAIAIASSVAANANLENAAGKIAATFWGAWAAAYAILACIQSGFIFIEALKEFLSITHIKSWPAWAKDLFAYIFGLAALVFAASAVTIISTSIAQLSAK